MTTRPFIISGPNAELTKNFYLNKLQEHPGDAGIDLFPLVRSELDVMVSHAPFGQIWRIETGVAVLVPEGFYGTIVGRSSSITKFMGCPILQGTIDHGYVGPLYVMLIVPNEHGGERPYTLELMDRLREYTTKKQSIAQMILLPYAQANFEMVDTMPDTKRGGNGFGSTDKMPLAGDNRGRSADSRLVALPDLCRHCSTPLDEQKQCPNVKCYQAT